MFARYQIIAIVLALTTTFSIAPQESAMSEPEESRRLVVEAWSLIDDYFFDGNFNNQDWEAIGLQYTKKNTSTKGRQNRRFERC
jgi:hypothetical protein